MLDTHAYLIGVLGLGAFFGLLCWIRPDLRRVMLYSGLLYLVYGFIIFIVIRLLTHDSVRTITPGYWTPPSLFNLNERSGGYGIEDAIFSFFAGGLAAGLYELFFKKAVSKKTNNKLKKGHALSLALVISSVIFVLTPLNAIYYFIFLQSIGAALIVWQRKDLLKHALAGGLIFMGLYMALFSVFILLFPHFLDSYYHLDNTSQIFIFKIPLEEYLYGLTLGMMWAPLYEYEYRVKDIKRRSIRPPRTLLAAAIRK